MIKKTVLVIAWLLFCHVFVIGKNESNKNIIKRSFKPTMTPIELNHGEKLVYTRKDGKELTIELISTDANILYTNKDKIPPDESGNDRGNMYRARLMYEYTADIKFNDIPMVMRRYVCSQESFFEPYVVNGVRIWFIGVTDIFEEYGGFLNTARSANGIPHKNARFVLQDMESRICPGKIYPWFKDGKDKDDNFIYQENFIDIGRCFNGDDCFMGAYLAGESHGALDINMAQNSLMYAPFDLDTQEGIRADGKKTWPDGSEWRINTGHIIKKYVPDHVPVEGGQPYGLGARRACWWHPHAHFGFQIFEKNILYEIDPWILFWQLFEDNKKKDGGLRAMMTPLSHTNTGEKVRFQLALSNIAESTKNNLNAYWTFGDGGFAEGYNPTHIFTKSGIYPVTLTIKKGRKLASFTQHITVEGRTVDKPSLSLTANDEPTFLKRPIEGMDVYGWPVDFIPHTLEYLARPSRSVPNGKQVVIQNNSKGKLDPVTFSIHYINNRHLGWLYINQQGLGNSQQLDVSINGAGFPSGTYEAIVYVHCNNALNSPQKLRVIMDIPSKPPQSKGLIVDDKDDGFYCTPYFWVGHRFHGWGWPELKKAEGYNNFYLINGQRDRKGEFARFTPDLEAGTYDIWLYEHTPFASGPPANNEPSRFKVRVVYADGEEIVWMEPERINGFYPRPYIDQDGWSWLEPQPSRKIGTFRFEEGKDGFVEILAEGSTGQVIVDAVRFLKMDE